MITIINRQKKISIDEKKLARFAQSILKKVGYTDFDLSILLTTDATIKRYNKQYRHKNKATDILSFAYHTVAAGKRIVARGEEKNLGDLIISVAIAQRDAKKEGVPLEHHLQRLIVHGICHLLGYDHETEMDYRQMHTFETQLLKK